MKFLTYGLPRSFSTMGFSPINVVTATPWCRHYFYPPGWSFSCFPSEEEHYPLLVHKSVRPKQLTLHSCPLATYPHDSVSYRTPVAQFTCSVFVGLSKNGNHGHASKPARVHTTAAASSIYLESVSLCVFDQIWALDMGGKVTKASLVRCCELVHDSQAGILFIFFVLCSRRGKRECLVKLAMENTDIQNELAGRSPVLCTRPCEAKQFSPVVHYWDYYLFHQSYIYPLSPQPCRRMNTRKDPSCGALQQIIASNSLIAFHVVNFIILETCQLVDRFVLHRLERR